jgi:predicted small lipoprotein YifL
MRLLISTVIAGIIMLSGCGQKGPLYIAQDKGAPVAAPDTDEAKPANEKKDGDKPNQ